MNAILRSTIPCASTILLTALLTAGSAAADDDAAKLEGIPLDGYEQILPRGQIAALVDPDFVSADEAELPDDAWVLGFERDGETFAYDLNLLNRHEVVNHGTESTRFAAVW